MSDAADEVLAEFTAVTGVTESRAKFYLESANGDLQLALSSYYEGDGDANVDDDDVESSSPQPPQAPTSLFASGGSEPSDSDAKNKAKSKSKNKYNVGGARIVTLNNMASDDDEEEDNSGQAFYAGGSDSSGQQVLGPSRKNKDFVSNIFKSARESGAEVVEHSHTSGPSGSRNFSGAGYRLGQTNDDHVLLANAPSRSTENMDPIILRLWRQGFTINDSELRLYEDQKNREFLEYITKGELPPELRQQGNMVPVNMEDHRHEDFKPSKIKPFSGKGHTLGSPTPNVNDGSTSIASASAPQSASQNEENEKQANENLKLDSSQPTTSIQIRLADGSRLSGRFNMSHTINDLRTYVVNARPQYATQTFALLTTFPSKELTDSEQTIEKAGLANAAIMQRLK